MKVYGIWFGGSNYAYGGFESMEEFPSLRVAKEALLERYDSNGIRTVPFWRIDPGPDSTLVPCVSTESCIDLFTGPEESQPEMYARISFGPRGGVRVERA